MEILITTSIGLYYSTTAKQHYLQVITARQENHYFLKITKEEAKEISGKDKLKIENTEQSFIAN